MLLTCSHQLRGHLLDLHLQLFEYVVHYLLVVRQVGFEPAQRLVLVSIPTFIDKFLELGQLLVGHLVGQVSTNAQLQCLVYVLEHRPLLIIGQASQTQLVE